MRKYFKKLFLPISIQLIFTIFYSITVALFPVLNKELFDNILSLDQEFIIYMALLYVGLIIVNGVFQYFARVYEWEVNKKFNIEIRNDLFRSIISLKNNVFHKKSPSEYVSIFNNNVNVIYDDYISATIDMVKSAINIIVFSIALFYFVDWRITIVVIVTSLITAFLPRITKRRLSIERKLHIDKVSNYFKVTYDLISGKKRVNKDTFDAINKQHDKYLINSENQKFIFGKQRTVADLIHSLGIYFVQFCTFITVAELIIHNEISVGTGVAAFGYVSSFVTPIKNILGCVSSIHSSEDVITETMSFINEDVWKRNEQNRKKMNVKTFTTENIYHEFDQFKTVPFSYTFEIGKKYAFIGHSGSGKTTLMRLLDGSIELKQGKIKINDSDIKILSREDYIFSLDQFEHLFETDFINNVTIFESVTNNMEVVEMLLGTLNNDTRNRIKCYESANQLSGGEKQIIYILRMLVANKPIILMDESYANIDKENANKIKNFLKSLDDKIIIEITHDISEENLSRFDEVLEFEEGKYLSTT